MASPIDPHAVQTPGTVPSASSFSIPVPVQRKPFLAKYLRALTDPRTFDTA